MEIVTNSKGCLQYFYKTIPSITCDPYQPTDRDACLNLYGTWQMSRAEKYDDEIYQAMLEDSQSAHRIGITHAKRIRIGWGGLSVSMERYEPTPSDMN